MLSVSHQFAFSATKDDDAATTAAALEETLEELNALDQWFSEAEKTRNDLQTQIRNIDRDIGALNKTIRTGDSQTLKPPEKKSTTCLSK